MVYGTSRLKRARRTREQLTSLDDRIYAIVEENQPITVRGVFYRAEVAGLVPKDERGYDLVQRRVLMLRTTGRMPYHWITDGTRLVQRLSRWDGIGDFAAHAASFYRRDYWSSSPVRVEVWIEKDALSGVVYPTVVEEWGLQLFVARGFSSATYLHNAAGQIRDDGRPTFVYVLGDFDPSGICAAEKIASELPRMAEGVEVVVTKLAVDHDQVVAWGLPTRPVKFSDSRARKFVEQFGEISAELDAIPPRQLRAMVGEAIARHADPGAVAKLKWIEGEERRSLLSWAGEVAD